MRTLKMILAGRVIVLAGLALAVVIAASMIAQNGRVSDGDHVRIQALQDQYGNLQGERRLATLERISIEHSERLVSIESTLRWLAYGIGAVLLEALLRLLLGGASKFTKQSRE